MAKKGNKSSSQASAREKEVHFIFNQQNYRWLVVSIAVVFVGFILMSGKTDIYDFRKIVLAPIVVLIGFGLGFYAIFKS